MEEVSQRLDKLSPKQRKLFQLMLLKKRRQEALAQRIPRRSPAAEEPLSFAQQRLWFLDRLAPGNPYYNMPRAIRFRGALQPAALGRALDEIIRRHEALRTVFTTSGDEPVQVVRPAFPLPLPRIDLAGLPAEAARRRAETLGAELMRQAFALEHLPLLRCLLVVLGPREHVLFLSIHHIVSDGWSQLVLAREVAELYQAMVEARPSPLPELPIQYADFAVWQRGWLDEEMLAAELDHWLRHLDGAPARLELPGDRPRPAVQTLAGAHRYFTLPPELSQRLHELSEAAGGSLYMTLAAAFRTLVMRITGRTDLVLGSPIANRHRRELEGLIGFFVNMLVMRTDLSGDPSFRHFLQQVQEVTLAAYENQDLPFERLVEALKPERDLSTTPIFQVMFNLLNFPQAPHELPDLEIDPWQLGTGTSKYDLSLYFFGDQSRLAGFFEYSTDLFDASTIERLLRYLETLLAGVVAEPDRRLSELPLMPEAERHHLLLEATAASAGTEAAGLAAAGGIAALIGAQAARTPDSVALEAVDRSLTYLELDRRVELLARALRRHGVGPEARVAVLLDRRADLVVALLAVLRAGGAYVPIDPDYPRDRIAFMLEDSAPRLALVEEIHRPLVEPSGVPALALDVESLIGDVGDEPPLPAVDPDTAAYVIYTSGSTGRPKGVVVPHRPVLHFLHAMARQPGLTAADTLLAITTLSFDIAGLELYLPLSCGARLVLAEAEDAADAVRLRHRLERSAVTAMQATPVTWRLLIDAGWRGGPSFRILCGGEALSRALADELLVRGAEVWNLYGPTETTIWSATARVEAGDAVALGRAIAGTRLHVVDPHLRLAPLSAPGELLIGGAGLARGYFRRPALTAERFVPDPFATEPGARLYRTGDLVRRRPGGELTFHGRIDHQVKVHGFRIELGEIEAALEARPEIDAAVVVAERRGALGDRLLAYAVPAADHPVDAQRLRRELAEDLPDYMVPAVIVLLDAFPRTGSGKVDRAALPSPDGQRATAAEFEAPATPLERYLESQWCRVLGVRRVGRDERFFDLGGNSIQAAVLINALQRELGEILHVTALFRAQTLRDLVAFLDTEYPEATRRLRRRLGEDAPATPELSAHEDGVGAFDVLALRRRIAQALERRRAAHPQPGREAPPRRLPPALFILSPPRSGSTLLRVMLAGHSRLFSPPELELLGYRTLGERRDDLTGPHSFAREGLLRAVMELEGCDADQAQRFLAALEDRDRPIAEAYAYLAEASGRMVVDKTSTYALEPAALAQAEELFEDARYIQLVRHPCATIKSYVDVRLDQFLRIDNPYSARQQAELLWTIGHQNIERFFALIPAERRRTVRFETLVEDPQGTSEELCRWLGIAPEAAMLQPYEGARMTDGLYAQSRMHGDPKFHQHDGIDRRVADSWRGHYRVEDLAPVTRSLALALGYAPTPEDDTAPATPEHLPAAGDEEIRLSFAQERLWLIDQIEPGSAAYHIPSAVRLEGPLDAAALERAVAGVIERHALLRTAYGIREGRPLAEVRDGVRCELRRIDLSGLDAATRQRTVDRLAEREALRVFDLARPPLLRTTLLRLAPEEALLLVTL
ncbi:MAG: amino acid adenylation domain-containing protein, partial [Acidobacteria bacterium]|nr:amino acid adenylation domain-containing protein [Acidobacteriota bacterium]